MLRYNVLFIHVISAMGVFTALGIEVLALAQLRRALDGTSARAAIAGVRLSQRIGGPSMLGLLLTGLPLATAYWHWKGAWMGLGFVGLVCIGAVGGVMTARRVSRLQRTLGTGELGTSVFAALPALRRSFGIRAAIITAVVYLMTVKPG